jgi:E3 ubiquitin-protein ligase DOA10
VSVVLLVELCAFPALFGAALDVATLPLFDGDVEARWALHQAYPLLSTVVHWAIGLAFMYSFATSLAWLRRTLRPGLLWMIRNPDDPNFDPMREIVARSMARHARRLCVSLLIYGSVLLSFSSLPTTLLQRLGLVPLRLVLIASDNNNNNNNADGGGVGASALPTSQQNAISGLAYHASDHVLLIHGAFVPTDIIHCASS